MCAPTVTIRFVEDRLVSGLDLRLEPEAEVRRFEVLNGALGHRRWGADQRARLLDETLAPGAVASVIAHRYGLTPQQLFTWRREARKKSETGQRRWSISPQNGGRLQIGTMGRHQIGIRHATAIGTSWSAPRQSVGIVFLGVRAKLPNQFTGCKIGNNCGCNTMRNTLTLLKMQALAPIPFTRSKTLENRDLFKVRLPSLTALCR
jgi:hypothetical protein